MSLSEALYGRSLKLLEAISGVVLMSPSKLSSSSTKLKSLIGSLEPVTGRLVLGMVLFSVLLRSLGCNAGQHSCWKQGSEGKSLAQLSSAVAPEMNSNRVRERISVDILPFMDLPRRCLMVDSLVLKVKRQEGDF